jgi:hypothetical protein
LNNGWSRRIIKILFLIELVIDPDTVFEASIADFYNSIPGEGPVRVEAEAARRLCGQPGKVRPQVPTHLPTLPTKSDRFSVCF